jgi:hypothetical protein
MVVQQNGGMLKIRRVLFWTGLLCIVLFFYPFFQHTTIPNGTKDTFTLGPPHLPWLVCSWSETKVEVKNGSSVSYSFSSSRNFNIEFITWSWLLAIGGAALIAVSRRLKTKATPTAVGTPGHERAGAQKESEPS